MKGVKWLIIALILIVAGVAVMGFAMTGGEIGRDGKMRMKYEQESATVGEAFHAILIDTSSFDVELRPTAESTARVDYPKNEYIFCEVLVNEGVLTVKQVDTRAWYQRIFTLSSGETKVTVYLPFAAYESLGVHVTSGDVTVGGAEGAVPMASFDTVDIRVTTGDVVLLADTVLGAKIKTTTGDVKVKNIKGSAVEIKTTSGDVTIEDCTPASLTVDVNSGEVEAYRVTVAGAMQITGTTGDVELRACDAATVYIKKTTGDVTAVFTSPKYCDIKTTTGDVEYAVPSDPMGGKCEIRVTTGDVHFNVVTPEP